MWENTEFWSYFSYGINPKACTHHHTHIIATISTAAGTSMLAETQHHIGFCGSLYWPLWLRWTAVCVTGLELLQCAHALNFLIHLQNKVEAKFFLASNHQAISERWKHVVTYTYWTLLYIKARVS